MERSIIGVYKANRGNWSAYGWRFTGGQATRLNGSKNGSSNKTSNMLNGADVRFILTEDKDPTDRNYSGAAIYPGLWLD